MTDDFAAIASRLGAVGCTPSEIAQVEADQGVPLPASYREFLRTMGRDLGGLLVGSTVTFPHILGARAWAVELVKENGVPHLLPASAAVVMLHQGYFMDFVDPAEGGDPPVRSWEEGLSAEPTAQLEAPSLLAWVLMIERSEAQHRRLM
ncbi:SMI1/KNR4 family protein [Cellulomonas xiejunii]|uniref:SMI1/KNR4 family protein n=1 Tax=Cellulomonas xiejunii TaxID=2968083 RepID=UPI001D0E544E|nr:SMI1/KNR4 family protein [Cellulomonas xiejunii]MCC2313572.1 SMI1/KNR4 family protein [Cellulomonas xiejunii]